MMYFEQCVEHSRCDELDHTHFVDQIRNRVNSLAWSQVKCTPINVLIRNHVLFEIGSHVEDVLS